MAVCYVGPNGNPCDGGQDDGCVKGKVTFIDDGEVCKIYYHITGLAQGKHGFHIHEYANFEKGCISAGPHYNPHGVTHGGRNDEVRHVGDLGNVVANHWGVAQGVIYDGVVKLTGKYSVVGRSVMVHAGEDDLGRGGHELSLTTGNAGGRIACGEIVLVDE
eukprot:CAMPEP_0185025180 /NCGR_PEP_ID=MMETSP1103-20130426/8244_1 /TAXON_ID=36769 /ORGANISM="Paraphysomonas bandaiensis, Strain Caron Lab Isolate" /LENGTH=160 /DNA_ID=CAMNT_0027558329 /DNA_START=202 /DNA_END=684 /DNA_ORIENTATION=+